MPKPKIEDMSKLDAQYNQAMKSGKTVYGPKDDDHGFGSKLYNAVAQIGPGDVADDMAARDGLFAQVATTLAYSGQLHVSAQLSESFGRYLALDEKLNPEKSLIEDLLDGDANPNLINNTDLNAILHEDAFQQSYIASDNVAAVAPTPLAGDKVFYQALMDIELYSAASVIKNSVFEFKLLNGIYLNSLNDVAIKVAADKTTEEQINEFKLDTDWFNLTRVTQPRMENLHYMLGFYLAIQYTLDINKEEDVKKFREVNTILDKVADSLPDSFVSIHQGRVDTLAVLEKRIDAIYNPDSNVLYRIANTFGPSLLETQNTLKDISSQLVYMNYCTAEWQHKFVQTMFNVTDNDFETQKNELKLIINGFKKYEKDFALKEKEISDSLTKQAKQIKDHIKSTNTAIDAAKEQRAHFEETNESESVHFTTEHPVRNTTLGQNETKSSHK